MAILSYLTTTHFDFGAVKVLPKELLQLGLLRPLITTDKGVRAAGLLERVLDAVPNGKTLPVFDETPSNPTERAALSAFDLYREQSCDGVIGLGGGSSMDLGKAVALLAGAAGRSTGTSPWLAVLVLSTVLRRSWPFRPPPAPAVKCQ